MTNIAHVGDLCPNDTNARPAARLLPRPPGTIFYRRRTEEREMLIPPVFVAEGV